MSYDDLRERVLGSPIGNHSARIWRIAENIQSDAMCEASGDRLLHLMSRVSVFCRGLATDLRSGHTTAEQAILLLDQLADIGDVSFDRWLQEDPY